MPANGYSQPELTRARTPIRKRAVVLGLTLALFMTWVQALLRLECSAAWFDIGTGNVPGGAIFCLLVLIGLNFVLELVGLARWRLNQAELLAVYALVAVTVSISTISGVQQLPAVMLTQFQQQTPENQWGELITDHVPDFLVPEGIRHQVGPYLDRLREAASACVGAGFAITGAVPATVIVLPRSNGPPGPGKADRDDGDTTKAEATRTPGRNTGWMRSPSELVDWRAFAPRLALARKYFTDHDLPKYKENFSTFFDGNGRVPWKLLMRPLLAWGLFATVLYWTYFCIMALARKQWVDNERLTFPIVIVPVTISQGGGNLRLFRNRMFVLGFLVAFVYALHLRLAGFISGLPTITLFVNLKTFLVNKPWNAIPMFLIFVNIPMFALAFLVPKDITLSFVFFNAVMTLLYPLGSALGWGGGSPQTPVALGRWPFYGEIGFGAFTGVLLVGVWLGRKHIRDVVIKAFAGRREIDDADEPMPYRLAFFGMVFGLVFLVGFACYAGMRVSLALLFFGIFFVYIFGITRVRAESALMGVGGPDWWGGTPEALFRGYAGSADLHPKSFAVMSNLSWVCGTPEGIMPPHQMEGFKMAGQANGSTRKLMLCMMVGVVVTLPLSIYCTHKGNYYTGAASVAGNQPIGFGARILSTVAEHLERKPKVDKPGLIATATAIAFSLFLAAMRSRFLWWPLHPVGFALGWSFWANSHWFSWLLAWAVKSLSLKFGGASTYRKILYMCIGLLVGTYTNSAIWLVYDLFTVKGGVWASRTFDTLLRVFT